ncbi:MAG TPA: argininosuccinate lyase [Vicinamibacterales bacterium]|nr:argininosuccinate lyase [Vicinamibacterales bacterium]
MGETPLHFSPDYVSIVLNEIFEDAKAQFIPALMQIQRAHLVMLVDQAIVSRADGRALRDALAAIDVDALARVVYDGTYEDLFFYMERVIVEASGPDVAGRLHTARSRNDIDMTMYRMRQRELLLAVVDGVLALRGVFVDLASRHRETIFAAHTHTQPAQPSTIAHYLLAVVEQLERDTARLRAAYASTNRNPLGACAITGTGFPIDRGRTTALLGFDAPTVNTYGSIATVDYLLESVSATAVLLTGVGRVVQDLLLWCMNEFGYLRLSDGFVQSSSIMPQKRNPVALEHARAIGSKALGQAAGIMLSVHNTPFGDIVDTEDDLQPLVSSMFKDAARTVTLIAAAMADAQFDIARLAQRAGQGWITVTELADTLARDHGLPFRSGHAIAARLIARAGQHPELPLSAILRDASAEVTGTPIVYDEAALAVVLSPRHFVDVRTTLGGPAPSETARALGVSTDLLQADRAWRDGVVAHLRAAEQALADAVAAL